MPTVRVSTKGQVVIPAEIREEYDIKPGTWLEFSVDEDGLHVDVLGDDLIAATRGILKDGGPSLSEELLKERARDRVREDTKFDQFSSKKPVAAGK